MTAISQTVDLLTLEVIILTQSVMIGVFKPAWVCPGAICYILHVFINNYNINLLDCIRYLYMYPICRLMYFSTFIIHKAANMLFVLVLIIWIYRLSPPV